MSSFYNFRNLKIQENKKDIDNTLNSNSIYYTHYNTEANTNPTTNINSFNISIKNCNENQTILSNYINQNQIKLRTINYEEEKYDKNDLANSPLSIDEEEAPTNIDEIIKNEISSSIIDSFLNQHQIKSIPMFILYLSEIWQELSKETNPSYHINKGINLFSFNKYYNLPGLIGKRLFELFDLDNNGFLCPREFITGMCTLFCEEINSLIIFIFNFCDFDRDNYITFDDMHAVLSYLPIINSFDDMIDIEEEIYSSIQDIFINKKEKIDYNTFYDLIIRKERYELFVPLISFLYENKPFNNEEINEFYQEYYNMGKINDIEGEYQIKNVINLKENENKNNDENKEENINNIFSAKNICKDDFNIKNKNLKNLLLDNTFNNINPTISEANINLNNLRSSLEVKKNKNLPKEDYEKYVLKSRGFEQMRKTMPLVISNSNIINNTKKGLKIIINSSTANERKKRFIKNNNQKRIKREGSIIYSFCKNKMKSSCMTFNNKIDTDTDEYEFDKDSLQKSVSVKMDTNINYFGEISWKYNNNLFNQQRIKCESYLYKITKKGKLKKLYFKLNNQDLFYYKNDNSKKHKGMHNLSTYFLEIKQPNNFSNKTEPLNDKKNKSSMEKENMQYDAYKRSINGIEYFCFLLINIKKEIHYYYTPDFDIYKKWINALKIILKYKNIYDQYIFREIIGKGKNCIVFNAYDIINKRNVAIKRINKSFLSLEDLSLIQTEIDILKVCQHPYVVKLYEIIETYNEVNIVLEHCELGNLYFYLSQIKFNLTEEQIATYIHDISKAVYSMHNLGIIHRDLKLSNIALTNHKGKIEIRILDFGLSKILGPKQYCNEDYGTPGYAAPEVISRLKYSYEADVWSIGVISFFLCEKKLPFDYIRYGRLEKDIIENTLLDEVKIDYNIMNKYSKYATKFIKDLMNKKVFERPNIREVLEHEWFQLYFKNEVKKRKINTYKNEFYENPEIDDLYTCDENIEKSKEKQTNFLLYTSINNK